LTSFVGQQHDLAVVRSTAPQACSYQSTVTADLGQKPRID
jgi:hypothetical protein